MGQLGDAIEKVVTELSLEITAELIERTPVDTGWARANWVPAIGNRPSDAKDPGSRESRASGAPGRGAEQQAAVAALATGGYSLEKGQVFISNGVPYIVFLDQGSSAQAPKGFVKESIMQGILALRGRRIG